MPGIEPAEFIPQIQHMIKFSPAGNDTGCEVQDFLDGGQIRGSTVSIHREAVSDVRDDQGGYDVRKGLRGKKMVEAGKANKDVTALTREATNMCVPGKMPIKGEAKMR